MKIELEVVKGAKAAKIHLKRLPTIIGRSADAALTLPTTKVSRRHCEIYEDEGIFVRDLESTNGTLVNKHPISKATELHTGDLLRVGPILFRVTCPQQPEPDESAIVGVASLFRPRPSQIEIGVVIFWTHGPNAAL